MNQVCPFWDLEKLATDVEFFRAKRGREELRRGNLPGYHLLNRCALPEKQTDFLVIDFRTQFAVKSAQLKQMSEAWLRWARPFELLGAPGSRKQTWKAKE